MSGEGGHRQRDMDRVALAGEIALGLIPETEAAAAMAQDPLLAREVAIAAEQFATLGLEVEPVQPPDRVLDGLKQRLADERAIARPAPVQPQVGFAARCKATVSRLSGSLALWRGLSGLGFASAAMMLALFMARPALRQDEQDASAGPSAAASSTRVLLVSPILPRDGAPSYVATYDPLRARLVVVPAATQPSRSGIAYLWLVPKDDGEPIGLGQIDPTNIVSFDFDARRRASTDGGASLVITLEPAAPRDGGAAAGPVMAHGKFSAF